MGKEAGQGAAGATPGQAATAGQAPGPAAATGATPPAAGSEATAPAKGPELGETGQEALRREREARRAAERRAEEAERNLNDLTEGTQSEHERALAQARREATASANAEWAEWGRDVILDAALRSAGITSDKLISLAKAAPELRELKFDTKTRSVEGVSEAVEKLKTDGEYAALFVKQGPAPTNLTAPPPGGSWGGSEGGGNATPVAPGMERLRRGYTSS